MPIKWNIAAKAMKARGIMDQISKEYDDLITDGGEHLSDVKALKAQVGEMKSDLYAAANVMGNGSANGGSDSQPSPVATQTEQAVIPAPETPQANPAPPQPIPSTFRAEAEQQIAAGHRP